MIIYLNSDASQELEVTGAELREAVLNHPAAERFTPKEFCEAFNDERISDLGYMFYVEETEKYYVEFMQRIGEYEMQLKNIMTIPAGTNPSKAVHSFLINTYGGVWDESDGGVYLDSGCIFIRVQGLPKKLTSQEAIILEKYL